VVTNAAAAAIHETDIKEEVRDGVHVRWGRWEIPPQVYSFHLPEADEPMPDRPFVRAEDCVPLGVYAGDFGDATWDWIFNDIKEHGGNSFYVNGSYTRPYPPCKIDSRTNKGMMALVRRAARCEVRVYYQNHSSNLHWPNRVGKGPPRQEVFDSLRKVAEQVLPRFASDRELKWGLLCWGITEEIDVPTARDPLLAKLKKEVFNKLDPEHPAVILVMHNPSPVQDALVETWGVDEIPIAITDPYPNHRGVLRRILHKFYLKRVGAWSRWAKDNGSRLWLVLPTFSERNPWPSRVKGGHRISLPQELRMMLWTGLAYGSSGFYLYVYYDYHPAGRAALTRFDWKPTEEYEVSARFFRTISRLAPLVGRWRLMETKLDGDILTGKFAHHDFKGDFLVVANSNPRECKTYHVAKGGMWDLNSFSRLTEKVKIIPGGGLVAFGGPDSELARVRKLLGPPPGRLGKKVGLAPACLQVWEVSRDGKSANARREISTDKPIAFGGKGALPVFDMPMMPGWEPHVLVRKDAEVLDWGEGVKVPQGVYYPPYPGAGDEVLFLRWDLSDLAGRYVERAVMNLQMKQPIKGGRLAVYPVVSEGIGWAGITEYMPRWEMDDLDFKAGQQLAVELTGIVGYWLDRTLENRGLLIVHEAFGGETSRAVVGGRITLDVQYLAETLHLQRR